MRPNAFVRWLFEDRRTGEIVVGQRPNLLLVTVAISTVAVLLLPRSRGARALSLGSTCLFGLDEATRGVNPFRRIGGALILLWAIGFRRRQNQ